MNRTEEDERIETSRDRDWVVRLENRLSDTKFRDTSREPTIYKVPDILKKVDHEAYEPLIVSFGPYHRDKHHLQAMNQLKWKYLKFVLEQNTGKVLNDYVDMIEKLERRARGAYSGEVEMSSNSFVEMMLLDGCFLMITIMELNIMFETISWTQFEVPQEWRAILERNFKTKILEESTWWTRAIVIRDIFILENQLPFFLLETLYESAFPLGAPFRELTFELICKCFSSNSSNMELPSDNETFQHIIHLTLSCIDPTTNHGNDNQSSSTFGFLGNSKLFKTVLPSKLCSSLLSQMNKICTVRDANPEDLQSFDWIPSATIFNEAGIDYKRKQKAKSFLDITFHNGKLEIPQLQINDRTNSVLRNLIAYEQCSTDSKFLVSSYTMLMNYLIDTAADVELLQRHEIIIDEIGDGQQIANLFNKLGTNVNHYLHDFYLVNVVTGMRKHRNTRYNKWRAKLNHDYFSNPWAVISLFGALALFVLTVTQTTYAVLSYDRSPN